MEISEAIKKVDKIKNGTFIRVLYKSEVPVNKEGKKLGYSITKYTEQTVRIGVNYNNIAKVIEQEQNATEPAKSVTNNYEWIIKNKICHNTNTGKDYLRVATTKNKNSHTYYITSSENGDVKSDDYDKSLVRPSYYSGETKESPAVKTIALENVLRIGA